MSWIPEQHSWGLFKSIVSSKGYRPSASRILLDFTTARPTSDTFTFEKILEDAIAFRDHHGKFIKEPRMLAWREKLGANRLSGGSTGRPAAGSSLMLSSPLVDEAHWRKLCLACTKRPLSNYGAYLLRAKLVRTIGARLQIDDFRAVYGDEIKRFEVKKPIFFIGLPRCNTHEAVHVSMRTGLGLGLRCRDTMFPGIINEVRRHEEAAKVLYRRDNIFPFEQTLRTSTAGGSDDDMTLQLLSPQSIAWGLWHGLDDYLYECIQEDQQPVYDRVRDVLQLFNWYRKEHQYSDFVDREVTPIDNPVNQTMHGWKDQVNFLPPWFIQSPLAILNIDKLHAAFPDMRLVWCHRALLYSIPSFCSALAMRYATFTGRHPTEGRMSVIGEQVTGMFGSGADQAIQYLATFPKDRMVHWSNRDINRHCTRLLYKTLNQFESGVDYFRRLQTINGQVEYVSQFRPKHDSELGFFALHEGIVNEAFSSYINQFEEYAFEKKFGITIQNYKSLSGTLQETRASIDANFAEKETSLVHMPSPGHFLQERNK